MAVHDIVGHEHEVANHNYKGNYFSQQDSDLCLIHNFKYYLYNFVPKEPLTEYQVSKVFKNILFYSLEYKEKLIRFFSLRAPPAV